MPVGQWPNIIRLRLVSRQRNNTATIYKIFFIYRDTAWCMNYNATIWHYMVGEKGERKTESCVLAKRNEMIQWIVVRSKISSSFLYQLYMQITSPFYVQVVQTWGMDRKCPTCGCRATCRYVISEKSGYPNPDERGRQWYSNTHCTLHVSEIVRSIFKIQNKNKNNFLFY